MERELKMARAKRLTELKQLIERSKSKCYVRFWKLKDGIPFLKSEKEIDHDVTINFTGCLTKEDEEIYKHFDLEQLATEQRKEVKNG